MNKMIIAVIAGVGIGFLLYFSISPFLTATATISLGSGNTPEYLSDTADLKSQYVSSCRMVCENLNANETLMQDIYDSYNELKESNATLADLVVRLPEDIYCDVILLNETYSGVDCNDDGDERDLCRCPELYSCTILNRPMVCRK